MGSNKCKFFECYFESMKGNIMAKFIFGNVILKPSDATTPDRYTLVNLYSFRRMLITEREYHLICELSTKCLRNATKEEQTLLKTLYEKKQILTDDTKRIYDKQRQEILNEKIAKIPVLINNISITLSFSCNFSCSYCYQRNFTEKTKTMTKEDIDQIIRYIEYINKGIDYRNSLNSVSFNGGEATLAKNIDLINYVLKKFEGSKTQFYLLTNGSRLIDIDNQLDLSRFSKIQISLDGDEKIIPLINKTDGNAFERIVQGIHLASKKCPNVEIACMITRELIARFDEFYRRLKDEGFLETKNIIIKLGYISDFKEGELDTHFLSLTELAAFRKEFHRKGYDRHIFINPLFETRYLSKILYAKSTKGLYFNEFSCGLLEGRTLMFTPDKKVHWCICADQENKPIGNYYQMRKKDIEMIELQLHRNVHEMEKCSCCDLKYLCTGGCPLYSLTQKNNLTDSYCGLYQNEEFVNNLEEYIW